jgi:hypothetical protein
MSYIRIYNLVEHTGFLLVCTHCRTRIFDPSGVTHAFSQQVTGFISSRRAASDVAILPKLTRFFDIVARAFGQYGNGYGEVLVRTVDAMCKVLWRTRDRECPCLWIINVNRLDPSARCPRICMASQGYDTVLPACSLEFCPSADSEAVFTVGTYKLEDSTSLDPGSNLDPGQPAASESQRRRGECLVFEMGDNAEDGTPTLSVLSFMTSFSSLDARNAAVRYPKWPCQQF